MLPFPEDPTLGDLGRVFEQSFKASGRAYDQYRSGKNPDVSFEKSPVGEMVSSSPGLFALRQSLPYQAGDTAVGRLIASVLPDELQQGVERLSLGGMSPQEKIDYADARAADPELRRNSVEIGRVPYGTTGEEVATNSRSARLAQAAGVVGADLAADGLRNIWWFLNAPQAVAQVAMFQGMRNATEQQARELNKAKGDVVVDDRAGLIRNRNLRMAAAAPAWIATSLGIGNFMRQPGYKAALPDPENPTQTTNPVGEFANRYFLGRTGSLLPYDEFVKERPDVSRQEYNAYKQYLFSGKSPIKATADGIQGPEVTFMGKSIPLATGIAPMVGAVIGARRGIKQGMRAVDAKGGYEKERKLLDAYRDAKKDPELDAETALTMLRKQQAENESQVAKSVIANSSAFTAGSAVTGLALESMRRALKGNAYEEDLM